MKEPVRLRSVPLPPNQSPTELKKIWADNPRAFDRGRRMRALATGEETFPSYESCVRKHVDLVTIRKNNWPAFTGVDLSGKKRPGVAIITIKVDPSDRTRYPVDVRFGAWKGSQTCEQLQDVEILYRPSVFMVEDNGYQESLIDWIDDQRNRFSFWMKVEATTTTGGKKANPDLGIPGLEVEFKRGGWVFPKDEWEGSDPSEPGTRGMWSRLDQELRMHPIYRTTDGAMALWFARQGILNYGHLTLAPGTHVGDLTTR